MITTLAAILALALAPAQSPELDQSIDAGQPVAEGQAVLNLGHADLGPRYVDGEWSLLVHDDTAEPPVWRTMADAVFQVADAALLTVPDDPAYAFLPAPPGTDVHVVPQTQNPDVVWVGWNTQDPAVMEAIDRGVTLTLRGVEGPGELVVFLQSGTLGEPDVLWDSRDPAPQDIWVEMNTHTHANWVFSEPGVYLVEVEVAADLVTGETASDTEVLRFAVGDATSTDEAFAATYAAAASPSEEPPSSEPVASAASETGDDGGSAGLVVVAVVAAAVLLLAAVMAVTLRGRAAKRRAELAP